MRIVRTGVVILTVYVGLGLLFGGFVGYLQPQGGGTARLITVDARGGKHETILRIIEDETGQIWLLSGQWFRGWYIRALDNPNVELIRNNETKDFHAVSITDSDTFERIIRLRRRMESTSSWWLGRALLLFAPLKLLRLDPP